MTNTIYTSTSIDAHGRRIVWNDNITDIFFYDASGESWDRTGDGVASWYLENTLPYDSFYSTSLSSDRWDYFTYRGTISGSVNNKLSLKVLGSDARGGLTSNGKWSLSGDFDIRLYMDETSYYNEYRGNSSSGLTVSSDNSNKFRLSKYFDGSSIGYLSHSTENKELKYYGWVQNGTLNTTAGEDETTCLRIIRSGDSISSFVSSTSGFVQVGSGISGSAWSSDLFVEIELETEQYNFYETDFLGFSVSGTLSIPTTFSSSFRGNSAIFPERSLLILDGDGLSIVDDSDMSLWMRFSSGDDNMFKGTSSQISASEGKIYYTTSSGVYCLDFVDDKSRVFFYGSKKETDSGLALRNFRTSYYNVGSSNFVPDNNILDVHSKKIGDNDFLAVATVSGIGMLINSEEEKVESPLSGRVQKIHISDDGYLYWNYFDVDSGRGQLLYRSQISSLVGDGMSTFSSTDYYSLDTQVSLSSEDINDISVNTYLSSHNLVLSNSEGIDHIDSGVATSFGTTNSMSPFLDPTFSNYLGVSWFVSSSPSIMFPIFDVHVSTEWSVVGSQSLKLTLLPSVQVVSGLYHGVYQQVDLTSVDRIYYDLKIVNNSGTSSNYIDLEVLAGGSVLSTHSDSSGSAEIFGNSINVQDISGISIVSFRVKSKYSGASITTNSFYVDNIRVVQSEPDYSIIPSSSPDVLEAIMLYDSTEQKIFFSTSTGYGAIDFPTKSLDYFTEIDNVISLSSILSADFVEYVDEI